MSVLCAAQTEATNGQKSMNTTMKASVSKSSTSASRSSAGPALVRQTAVDRKLRSGQQAAADQSKPVRSAVPSVSTASRQQVCSRWFSQQISSLQEVTVVWKTEKTKMLENLAAVGEC